MMSRRGVVVSVAIGGAFGGVATAEPMDTSFTYQAVLRENGGPAVQADLQFRVFDALAGGEQVGP